MNNQEDLRGEESVESTAEVIDENVLQIEKLRQEASEFKHKYLHTLADNENARKRLQKERDEIIQYTRRDLLLDFLNPIDHMENALKYTEGASSEVKHWASGFKMILNQFKDVLVASGVRPIDSIGKPFDPHFHEAIEMVETSNHPPGIVVEEHIRGYTMGEKTLRPARVKVSKAAAVEPQQVETKEDSQ